MADVVDNILRGNVVAPEGREMNAEGEVKKLESRPRRAFGEEKIAPASKQEAAPPVQERRIYPFGVSRQRLTQAIRQTRFPGLIVEHLDDADAVITLRPYFRRKPQTLHDAEARGIPVYVVKSNTIVQLEQVLLTMRSKRGPDPVVTALEEAENAIGQVLTASSAVDLNPQNAYIRRLQHLQAQRYNLLSRSLGKEPDRYVRIGPTRGG